MLQHAPLDSMARQARLWRVAAVALPVGLALWMALTSGYNRHPDEHVHLDAFSYFSAHSWPPPLDADGLLYSWYGWSRVYSGELPYWVYGRVQTLLRLDDDSPRLHRSLNVALLALTLGVLLFGPKTRWRLDWLGLFLGAVPQFVYLFSYANSDAWGVAAAVLLFAAAARLVEREDPFTLGRAVSFGALAGLLCGGKTIHLVGLLLPLGLLLSRARTPGAQGGRAFVRFLAVGASMVLLVNLPLKVVYPLSQGDFAERAEAMREKRAKDGYKPSAPHVHGYRLAEKGVGYAEMLDRFPFFSTLATSSYAHFGYLHVRLPRWGYGLALALLATFLALRGWALRRAWSAGRHVPLGWASATLALLAAHVGGLLVYCLHVDFQPQGRYAMALLPAVFVLLVGPDVEERARGQRRVEALLALAWVVGLALFWAYGIRSPALR